MPSRRRAVGLAETFEHVGEKLFVDPLSRVADDDLDVTFRLTKLNLHASLIGRELDGVREKIPDNLLQAVGVARNAIGLCVKGRLDLDALGLSRRAHGIDRRFEDDDKLDRLNIKAQLARDDARGVEYVFDDLRLRFGVALDGLDGAQTWLR